MWPYFTHFINFAKQSRQETATADADGQVSNSRFYHWIGTEDSEIQHDPQLEDQKRENTSLKTDF